MSATVTVSVRIPLAQIAKIRRAAKAQGVKLATFVREASYETAVMQLDRDAATTKAEAE